MPLPTVSPAPESLEHRYYAYLRALGYSTTEALLDVLRVYVPLFAGRTRIADLGCGHGEFLALLHAQGHEVAGVDIDPEMVAACRAQGFDVEVGDAEAWLDSRPETFDGIFSSNVVEHLPAAVVAGWVGAAYRALRPGGILVLATPNPESAIVQLHEFWRDATHVRLYGRQLLEFLLADAGFTDVASHENPAAAWEGVDSLLEGIDTSLPAPAALSVPAAIEPLPQAPPPEAPWRQRVAWSLASFIYAKFSAPFVAPLRADVERQLVALQQQAQALQAERAALEALHARVRRAAAAHRFLYPPREIYVVGAKPASA
jgi:SAM-dependent methyltransferase